MSTTIVHDRDDSEPLDADLLGSFPSPFKPDSEAIELIRNFSSEEDPNVAFGKLNELTEWISRNKRQAEELSKLIGSPQTHARVLELDSWAEKHFAQCFSSSGEYPWEIPGYYRAEVSFIRTLIPQPEVKSILQIGHGAIPQAAQALLEVWPEAHYCLLDKDPEVAPLARRILSQVNPSILPKFVTATHETLNSLRDHFFDLAVVSNAVLASEDFKIRDLPARWIFVRSATEAGQMLYPRLEPHTESKGDFKLLKIEDDLEFGIHQWLLFKKEE